MTSVIDGACFCFFFERIEAVATRLMGGHIDERFPDFNYKYSDLGCYPGLLVGSVFDS